MRHFFLLPAVFIMHSSAVAIYDQKRDGCTSMIFGKSVVSDRTRTRTIGPIVTHVSDCSDCDARMAYIPSRNHAKGKLRPVFDGTHSLFPRIVSSERSDTYRPVDGHPESDPIGFIAEVEHTFGLWENFYPLMNERGLAFGESTTEGKPMLANAVRTQVDPKNPAENGTAVFTISPLMSIAMERCESARCAINIMGTMAQSGGFAGEEYATAEAVTIVDRHGEAWVFEIVGDGNREKPGALWVAQRVPDDHVAVVANNMIIRDVVLNDPENFMFSDNLIQRTKELGIYRGSNDIFHWSESVGEEIPLPQYSAMRTWRVFSQLAPSKVKGYSPDPKSYPFSVKVEGTITIEDVMNLHRDHYQGTEFDLSQGVLAGVWSSPSLEMGATPGVIGGYPRAISIMRSSYTTIGVPLDKHPKFYFAVDQPMTSVFVPFYAEALIDGEFHSSFGTPHGPSQQIFNRSSAWWAFDFVSNWMGLNYRNMSIEEVYPARDSLQSWVFDQIRETELHAGHREANLSRVLAHGQATIQGHVTNTWWNLADSLIVKYNDGFYNFGKYHPDRVVGIQYPTEWLRMIGYSMDFYTPSLHWLAPAGVQVREIANVRSLTADDVSQQPGKSSSQIFGVIFGLVVMFLFGHRVGSRRQKRPSGAIDSREGYRQI